MENTFNLTTTDGWKKANKFLGSLGLALLGPIVGTIPLLILEGLKLFSPGITAKKQADAAKEIIEAGRKNNVDEMEITMSSEAGAKLKVNANYEGLPIDIEGRLGSEGKIIMKIKYK
jgi:hypothetical protein